MTFDGPNKLIVLTTATLDLIQLWSDYKTWLLAGNAGYALALDTVGGDPIDPVAGTLVPLYLFVQNGWKLRPMESSHTLSVTNGSLIGESGGDPFVSTIGNYNVRIKYQQPVQAFGYSTTGGGSGPSAAEIWSYATRSLTVSPYSLSFTSGSIPAEVATEVLAQAQVTPIHADAPSAASVATAVWSHTQ